MILHLEWIWIFRIQNHYFIWNFYWNAHAGMIFRKPNTLLRREFHFWILMHLQPLRTLTLVCNARKSSKTQSRSEINCFRKFWKLLESFSFNILFSISSNLIFMPSNCPPFAISPQKQCIFAVFDKHVYLLEQKRPIKVSLSITGPVGHRHNAEG